MEERINNNNSSWDDLVKQARSYRLSGNQDAAIQLYDHLLTFNDNESDRAQIFYERGSCYLDKDLFMLAFQDFTSAITLKPESNGSAEYYSSRAVTLEKLKHLDRVLLDYNKAISLDSNCSIFYSNRASFYYYKENYVAAFHDFVKAKQLDTKDKELQKSINNTIEKLSEQYSSIEEYLKQQCTTKESLSFFEQLLQLCELSMFKNKKAEVYYKRALFHKKITNSRSALVDCELAIKLNDKDSRFFYLKGILQEGEEAVSAYQKAISLQPNNAEYYISLAQAQHKIKEYKLAIANFNKAIQLGSKDFNCHSGKAAALNMLGQKEEAIASYTQAINLQPDDHFLRTERAALEIELGQYTEALCDYKRAIFLDRNNANYYNALGNLFLDVGENHQAFTHFAQAITLTPTFKSENDKTLNFADAWYFKCKGFIAFYLKRYDEALRLYNIAMKLMPNEAGYYFQRGVIFCELEQFDNAIADFDKVIDIEAKNDLKKYSERANNFKKEANAKMQEALSAQQGLNKSFGHKEIGAKLMSNKSLVITEQNKIIQELEQNLLETTNKLAAEIEARKKIEKQIERLEEQMSKLFLPSPKNIENVSFQNN